MAIALLIAAALGYRALLLHQRDAARAAAAHLSASLADAEASNAALQSAIATQNSAVAQLRAELEQGVQAAAARERAATARGTAEMRCGGERRALAPGRADRRRLRGGDSMGQRAGGGAKPMVMREAQDLDNAARSAANRKAPRGRVSLCESSQAPTSEARRECW